MPRSLSCLPTSPSSTLGLISKAIALQRGRRTLLENKRQLAGFGGEQHATGLPLDDAEPDDPLIIFDLLLDISGRERRVPDAFDLYHRTRPRQSRVMMILPSAWPESSSSWAAAHLGQLEAGEHRRLDGAIRQMADHALHDGAAAFAVMVVDVKRKAADGGADVQMLAHLLHHVLRRQAVEGVVGNHRSPFIQRAQMAEEIRTADMVEHEIDAAPAGQFADARDDVFAAIIDDAVGAHGAGEDGLLLRADGPDHGHARKFCQLHQR